MSQKSSKDDSEKKSLNNSCSESEEEIAGIIVECIPEKLHEPALEGNSAEQI